MGVLLTDEQVKEQNGIREIVEYYIVYQDGLTSEKYSMLHDYLHNPRSLDTDEEIIRKIMQYRPEARKIIIHHRYIKKI
jgi:hypothetical protein